MQVFCRAYVRDMGEERNEIYERIPWDAIDRPAPDRRWLAYAVAGAIALGSITYSFMSRPVAPSMATATTIGLAAPSTTQRPASGPDEGIPTEQAPPPLVVSEADLMAVDPTALAELAVAHAEWFAYEYIGFDGSTRSSELLQTMMPADIALPESPSGNQVWVDWARAMEVRQLSPSLTEVDVVVRSLMAAPGGEFERLPARKVSLVISIDGEGVPAVSSAPVISEASNGLGAAVWDQVAMVTGIDGVIRPHRFLPDQP